MKFAIGAINGVALYNHPIDINSLFKYQIVKLDVAIKNEYL